MKKLIFILLLIYNLSVCSSEAQNRYTYTENGQTGTFTAQELKEFLFSGLRQNIKQLNAQLPVKIDDYTYMYSAVLNGSTINYNYTVYIDSSLLSEADIEAFCEESKAIQKENMKFLFSQNADKMPVPEWIRLYKELGIKYYYNYIDANRRAWARIVVDFEDF
ncbi:MAG: hypothetical protein PUD39_00905 [Bacteroidales bacterium]|nr:hypothetical protein [Bacteroidales bacterium]